MQIKQNIPLKNYSNFKTGGAADYFVEILSVEELKKDLKELPKNLFYFVLAGGTNILVSDEGYRGVIVHNQIKGIRQERENLIVGSGVLFSDLLNFCIENLLTGLEWAGGLPGTIGGAVRGNAGAFGKETKDNVIEVISINYESLKTLTRTNKQCQFSYRNSFFKTREGSKEIITEIKLRLEKGDKEEIEKAINEKIEYRKKRHPLEYPTLGSTFKNVPYDSLPKNLKEEFKDSIKNDPFPVIPVVKILTNAEVKGLTIGDAQFSKKHPNFLINLGNAKFQDAKELILLAKQKVMEKFGIELEEEIIYLGNSE